MTEPSWRHEPDAGATLEENWLFRLRRERFRSRNSGRAHDFYLVQLSDCVNVIAVTPERQVVLIRQFRAGSQKESLETPGGLLDVGEDPVTAGLRELKEETGYAGDDARVVSTVWSNSSILTSRATTIVVTNARPVAPTKLEPGEEITLELVPATDLPRLIASGQVDHSLVVLGLLWWLAEGPLGLPAAGGA
jgi:8-oxo-dGTP pyrophosphatase MutT (NUDIX family)